MDIEVPPCHRAGRPALARWLGRRILAVAGWRITGNIPNDPHLILAGGPHTSNWDFVIGMAALLALDLRVCWIGKDSIFRRPFVGILTRLGGIPIDRSRPEGFVDIIARRLSHADAMIIAIAPEGTRSRVAKMKTGFLRIARAAGCRVQLVTLDFGNREFRFGDRLVPGDHQDRDLARVRAVFASVQPRNPENF